MISLQVKTETLDVTSIDAALKSAVASGSLLTALRDGPDGALFQSPAGLVFVSSEPLQGTMEEVQELLVVATRPLFGPILIALVGFIAVCCGCCFVCRRSNATFDKRLAESPVFVVVIIVEADEVVAIAGR